VFTHGYLLVGGEKMSKTRLNQIVPADLVEEFGSDGLRYHFLADQRFGPDGDFSYEALVARYNADLANNFGNLATRVLNMAVNYCDGVVPATRANGPLAEAAARAFAGITDAFTRLDFATGFSAVWDLIRATNSYIEDTAPWKLNKAGDVEGTAAVLGDCLEALRIVALLASPVIPRAAAELWRRLGLPGVPEDQRLPEGAAWGQLPSGSALEKGDPLFPRNES
jgi:methionyl-tRNA synthetase